MNTVKFEDYQKIKKDFYQKHGKHKELIDGNDLHNLTTVRFEDGGIWYETTRTIDEEITGEVHGVPYRFLVIVAEIEFWTNENSESQVTYRKV